LATSLASDVLPATVRRFVEGYLDTVTAVEVLLLLHRESSRAWSSGAVARHLRIHPDQTSAILDGFDRIGLVRRHGRNFEYGPRTEETTAAVNTLADVYPRYRYRVMELILAKGRF
jgi:DNA-binding IclR family transcriptional regulator